MKFLSNILIKAGLIVEGVTELNAAAATVDTDKFVVLDGSVIKFRTGAQILSDIGAQALLTNPVTGTGSAGQVAYWTGTTTQAGSNNLFFNTATGSLGIGTTSTGLLAGVTRSLTLSASGSGETASLEIQGNRSADQNAGIISFYNSTNRIAFISGIVGAVASSGVLAFSTHLAGTANEVMRLTSSGNMHVGSFVSDSGDRLQVSGVARIYSTGAGNSTIIRNNSTDASIFIGGAAMVGSTAARNIIVDPIGSYSTLTGGRNYVFGRMGAALTTASDNVFIGSHGSQLTTGGRNVFIGAHNGASFAFGGGTSRVIFISTGVDGTEGTGKAIPSGNDWAFIGGYTAGATTNQFYFGASPFINHPFAASLTDVSFFAPSGLGTDFAGGDFIFNAGRGTGTGAPGDLIFRTSNATTTGTTLQTLSDRMIIAGGTGAVRLNAYGSGGRTGTPAYDLAVDSSGNVIEVAIGSGMVTGAGAAGQLTYWDSATNVTGSNNLFWDNTNGRLGIGTNAPVRTLDVRGFISAFDGTTRTEMVNGGGVGYIGTLTNHPLALQTNNIERIRLHAGGNLHVGGTTDNGLRFQVTGDGFFSGSVGIGATSLSNTNLNITKNLTGLANVYGIFNSGSIRSDVTTGAQMFTSAPSIQNAVFTLAGLKHFEAVGISSVGSATITSQFGFYVESLLTGATNNYGFFGNIASGTGRWNLYMNGTAANYLAGSLGIGVTAPVRTLHVNGGTGVRVSGFGVRNSTQSANSGFIQVGGSDNLYGMLDFNAFDSNTIFEVSNTNANANAELRLGGGFVSFRTGATPAERMRLDASGNLGLGVTPSAWNWSGSSVLQVRNTSLYGVSNDGGIVSNAFFSTAFGGWFHIASARAALYGHSSGNHQWFTSTSGTAGTAVSFTQAMTLFPTGNLAVGTTGDAGFRLDVNGTMRCLFNSGASPQFTSENTAGGSWNRLIGSSTNANIIDSNNNLLIRTGASYVTRLTIASTGEATFSSSVNAVSGVFSSVVNIAGASSVESLNVNGNIMLQGTANRYLRIQSATNYFYNLQSVNDDFHIVEAGTTPRLVIKYPNGNIGIGTINPTSRLDVQGTFNATGAATFSSSGQFGGGTTNASAILQADSTTRGFLPPRMTSTQRAAIASPAIGLVVYQTDGTEGLYIYTNASGWKSLAIVN